MNKMIRYGEQCLSEEDKQAVLEVLESGWLTQGPKAQAFGQEVAHQCQAEFGVAMCNATAALHVACLALDLGKGDRLWTSPNTFVASANCALYCGAQVDFVDICPKTYNLDPARLEEKLIDAKKTNQLPKIVVAVHFAGQPCDMNAIFKLSQEYGFKVIEDASHALGATYQGEPVGNCRYSDVTVFSFHPVKIITSAEGGVLVTHQKALAQKSHLLANHGITRDPDQMLEPSHGPWYYQQLALGFNYRMTEFQGALGLSQLKKLSAFVQARRQRAHIYDTELRTLPITLPWQHPDGVSAYHLYPIQLQRDDHIECKAKLTTALLQAHVGVNLLYIPVHTQPVYQRLGFKWGDFPCAEAYYRRSFVLPLHPKLTLEEQHYVIEQCQNVLT